MKDHIESIHLPKNQETNESNEHDRSEDIQGDEPHHRVRPLEKCMRSKIHGKHKPDAKRDNPAFRGHRRFFAITQGPFSVAIAR
jgi:hypothetical protein